MESTPSTPDIVGRAIAGDTVALTVLLTQREDGLRRRLAPKIPADMRDTLGADDLLQDIYCDVFRGIANFESRGAESFDRWLSTVALRRLRAHIRRHRAGKRGGGRARVRRVAATICESSATLLSLIEAADRTPSRKVAGKEAVSAVQAALMQLPEDYREAVRRVYLEGQSVAEVAAALGRTPRAIHNLCHKARLKLRELLGTRSEFLSGSS